MSRAITDGLLYFSFDCDFFSNRNIKIIRAHFGSDGILVFIYILCDIYRNGYYIKVDEDYKFILAADLNIAEEKIEQIFRLFIDRSIFDTELYQSFGVISSKNIQLRFQAAIKERAKKKPRYIKDYWLLSAEETEEYIKIPDRSGKYTDNSENKDDNSEIYHTKVKVKKNKEKVNVNVNETKVKPNLSVVVDFYKKYFGDIKQEETNRLAELLEKYEDKLIMECILIATQKGIKKLSYIIGILKNLDKSGITTLEQYERSKRNDTFTGTNEKHNEQHTQEYGTTV